MEVPPVGLLVHPDTSPGNIEDNVDALAEDLHCLALLFKQKKLNVHTVAGLYSLSMRQKAPRFFYYCAESNHEAF